MEKKRKRTSQSPIPISSHIGTENNSKSGDEYYCSYCNITIQAHGIDIHFERKKKHKRLQKLKIYYPFLLD